MINKSKYINERVTHLLKTRTAQEMAQAAARVENLEDEVQLEIDEFEGVLTPEQCVEVCNTVAWLNRGDGWGISKKTGGERAKRYDGVECALDILHHKPTGIVVDCIGGSGGTERPTAVWIVHGVNTQANRPWVAPIQPLDTPVKPPVPPVVPSPVIEIDRGEFYNEMLFLESVYVQELKRTTGLSIGGRPDYEGLAAWIFDVYLNARLKGKSREVARNLYLAQIRQSDEWKLNNP